MENAHERRWPPGLSTLETRQLNRRQYENYATKRIPGAPCEAATPRSKTALRSESQLAKWVPIENVRCTSVSAVSTQSYQAASAAQNPN